jgi:hypothetical protein
VRHRSYFFLWVVVSTIGFIMLGLTGNNGWLWITLFMSNGALLSLIFILQIANYSEGIVSDQLKTSTDGRPFAHCPALGESEVSIPYVLKGADGATKKGVMKTKVAAWPKASFFEGGTATWGLANKFGGGFYGFIIVADHLLVDLSPNGNMAMLGATWTLRPHKLSLIQLLRRTKATEQDERRILPPEWWERLIANDRFDPETSPVHVLIDPNTPVLMDSPINGRVLLALPGMDTETRTILPTPVDLKELIGDHPIIDMRPHQKIITEAIVETTRKWAGREVDASRTYIQKLEERLARLTSIQDVQRLKDQFTQQVKDTAMGQEQGIGRQAK